MRGEACQAQVISFGDMMLLLGSLPEKWLALPFNEVTFAQFHDTVIVCHPNFVPMNLVKGKWEDVMIVHPESGHA